MTTIGIIKIVLPILAIWIALCLLCALWVTRRRRTGEHQVAGDPYFRAFGEMPVIPPDRRQISHDFRAWGIPETNLKPSARALRRNEGDGRSISTSGTAVVLTFPERA